VKCITKCFKQNW